MAEYRFDATFSELQIRRSARTFLLYLVKRDLDWKLGVAISIVAIALFLRRDDPAGWLEWSLLGVVAFIAVFAFILYRAHMTQSLERLRAMKTPTARFELREESLTMASDLGSIMVPWSTFTEVIDNGDTLLLIAKPIQLVVLPKAGVDPAALEFVRQRVLSSGNAV